MPVRSTEYNSYGFIHTAELLFIPNSDLVSSILVHNNKTVKCVSKIKSLNGKALPEFLLVVLYFLLINTFLEGANIQIFYFSPICFEII